MAGLDGDVAHVMGGVVRQRAFGKSHAVQHDQAQGGAGGNAVAASACPATAAAASKAAASLTDGLPVYLRTVSDGLGTGTAASAAGA